MDEELKEMAAAFDRVFKVYFRDGYKLADGRVAVFDGKALKRPDVEAWRAEQDAERRDAKIGKMIQAAFGITKKEADELSYLDYNVLETMVVRFVNNPLALIIA